jgi:hypothetical protein
VIESDSSVLRAPAECATDFSFSRIHLVAKVKESEIVAMFKMYWKFNLKLAMAAERKMESLHNHQVHLFPFSSLTDGRVDENPGLRPYATFSLYYPN